VSKHGKDDDGVVEDSTVAAEATEAVELTESAGTEAESAEAAGTEPAEPKPVKAAAPQEQSPPRRRIPWARVTAYRVLPGLAVLLAAAAVVLWFLTTRHSDAAERSKVVQVARDGAVALLSYQPDTVRQQLTAARKLLTTPFLDEYTSLTQSVIPGAEQKHISAVATVPSAAAVSVAANHAVVLVFVNQTVTVGGEAPTATPTSVRVTLERLGGQWLIAKFEPV
jgi:Mce-associated membrane protein